MPNVKRNNSVLCIIVEKNTSRLAYLLEVFFSTIVQIPYQTLELALYRRKDSFVKKTYFDSENTNERAIWLNYTREYIADMHWMPPSGLLNSEDIAPQNFQISLYQKDLLYCQWRDTAAISQGNRSETLPDFFSSAFYILTEYELALAQQGLGGLQLDLHHRLYQPSSALFRSGYYKTPIVERYVHRLLARLSYPSKNIIYPLQRPWLITVDIDSPWRYLHKKWYHNMGALARDFFQLKTSAFARRLYTLYTQKDPYATLSAFLQYFGAENLIFFWLIGGKSILDTPYTLPNKALAAYIQHYQKQKVTCGLHPSYLAPVQPQVLAQEKIALEDVLGSKIQYSRYHFFRMNLPEARSSLLALGINCDFTTALIYDNGFLHGMARPFYWFDLYRNTATQLLLYPTHIMDRTFMDYLKVSPDVALEKTWSLYQEARKVKGGLTLLLHNPIASGVEEWAIWYQYFNEIAASFKCSTE
jgi:hypothetical protein